MYDAMGFFLFTTAWRVSFRVWNARVPLLLICCCTNVVVRYFIVAFTYFLCHDFTGEINGGVVFSWRRTKQQRFLLSREKQAGGVDNPLEKSIDSKKKKKRVRVVRVESSKHTPTQ